MFWEEPQKTYRLVSERRVSGASFRTRPNPNESPSSLSMHQLSCCLYAPRLFASAKSFEPVTEDLGEFPGTWGVFVSSCSQTVDTSKDGRRVATSFQCFHFGFYVLADKPVNSQNIYNLPLNVSPPPSALRHSGHPLLAVVSDSLREKDCSLHRLNSKAHTHF